jgi:4-fold beta flower protein
MSPRHIYNTEGFWVAFIVEDQVFDCTGDLIGRLVDGHELFTTEGSRLGTIGHDGRLLSSL